MQSAFDLFNDSLFVHPVGCLRTKKNSEINIGGNARHTIPFSCRVEHELLKVPRLVKPYDVISMYERALN